MKTKPCKMATKSKTDVKKHMLLLQPKNLPRIAFYPQGVQPFPRVPKGQNYQNQQEIPPPSPSLHNIPCSTHNDWHLATMTQYTGGALSAQGNVLIRKKQPIKSLLIRKSSLSANFMQELTQY